MKFSSIMQSLKQDKEAANQELYAAVCIMAIMLLSDSYGPKQ
jgi:hypothetical protein